MELCTKIFSAEGSASETHESGEILGVARGVGGHPPDIKCEYDNHKIYYYYSKSNILVTQKCDRIIICRGITCFDSHLVNISRRIRG